SSYDEETEVEPSSAAKVLILGSGPNRIGQGIEFDYSCVHAVMALREAGSAGPAGSASVAGSAGPAGSASVAGSAGPAGSASVAGSAGPAGSASVAGSAGPAGSASVAGYETVMVNCNPETVSTDY